GARLCHVPLRPAAFLRCRAPTPPALYPLSLHDALPICPHRLADLDRGDADPAGGAQHQQGFARLELGAILQRIQAGAIGKDERRDRKSTRLNSSHVKSSYAVFCLKKKMSATI